MEAGVVTSAVVVEPRSATRLAAAARRLATALGPALPAIAIIAVALWWGAHSSPYFLKAGPLLINTGRYVEIGLLALALTVVVINGDIDLSVASNMAVSAAALGLTFEHGVPIALCCMVAVLTGVALGAANGVLVTRLGLPSLVVTLGTLALYRGLAQIMLRDRSISDFPAAFSLADQVTLFGTTRDHPIPLPLVAFLLAAGVFWFVLQRTSFGLSCFLTGSNQAAARFSGIPTARVRFTAFALSGLMAGVAAVFITSRLASARANLGSGMELPAITVVVLGGTSIFGGYGSIAGTTCALFAVMTVREALTIDSVLGETQDAVIGGLLIASILVPRTASHIKARLRRRREPT